MLISFYEWKAEAIESADTKYVTWWFKYRYTSFDDEEE